jgi:hypothetical protein
MIYIKLKDKSIYYVNIQDIYDSVEYSYPIRNEIEKKEKLEKFVEFRYEDLRITDLIQMIRENDYIYVDHKKQTIQNALIKADIITLFVGMNEVSYGLSKKYPEDIYNYMDTLLLDIETLLEEIKKYSKEKVFFIGYYYELEKDKGYITYLNEKLEKICKKEGVTYIPNETYLNKNKNIANIQSSVLNKFTFS